MRVLFITILLLNALFADAQVTLQPIVPAAGMIQKSQLWNLLAINSSSEQYSCRVDLVIRDRSTNTEVITAASSIFSLNQGAIQVNINTVSPVQYNHLSPEFDTRLTGLIPVGSYVACYSLKALGNKEVNLAEECIQFDVEPLSPAMLISPADSSVLDISPGQFSWIPPAPAGMFNNLNYALLITAVNDGQTAEEAIQQNIPLFNGDHLMVNLLNYSGAYPAFEKDKWYAWQVLVKDQRSYGAKTETWVFKLINPVTKPDFVNGTFISLDHISGTGMYNLSDEKLNVKYYSFEKPYEAIIRIRSTGGKVIQEQKQKIVYGDNYFSVNSGRKIIKGSTYTIELTGLDGKGHSAVFRIIN